MTASGHCFVEWKEQFISQARGNRVVHYFLKDSTGESTLAVVGTERSVRHMFYVVAEEFVRAYGAENSIHAGFKWRSRREVVDWLTSMLSKQHLQGDHSKSPKHDLAQALESVKHQMNDFGTQQLQGCLSRNLNGHSSEIVWSGLAWACGKQLKHYQAFCRNAITIAVQSFVFVLGKGEIPYVAYLEDMYEDKRGQKKVKVRWFHHNQEVKGVVPLRNPHPKEVFMTQNSQVISAECVDGPATVLTREHYEECLAAFPNALSARVHLCLRQFRNNKVKPFDVRKLHGYFDQPILACLNSKCFHGADSIGHVHTGEDEDLSPNENVKPGPKRTRSSRSCETFTADHLRISANQMLSFSPSYLNFKHVKYGMSGKRMLPFKHVGCQSWQSLLFKVDEKIELLCQDSGIRGCWFRCTVLQVSRKQIKVQYEDVQDEDEYGNLEEWIPAFKLAVPDKLGMRCPGRPILRPSPPPKELAEPVFEVGSAVDAWWSDGWWEGIVTGINNSNDDSLQVYFPGENNNLSINKMDLRMSRDWVGGQWVDIQARSDILPVISPTVSADTKVSISSIVATDTTSHDTKDMKSNGVAAPSTEVLISPKVDNVEETKAGIVTSTSPDNLPEDMDCDDDRNCSLSDHKVDGDILVEIEVQEEVGGMQCDDSEHDADATENCMKLDTEVTLEKNCKGIELMEVTVQDELPEQRHMLPWCYSS